MKIISLAPNLGVRDVRASVAFYEKIGLRLGMAVPETQDGVLTELPADGTKIVYAQLRADGVEMMLQDVESLGADVPPLAGRTPGATGTIYFTVEGLDEIAAALRDSGAKVAKELGTTWYGMREIYFEDPDGYLVALAEPGK